MNGLPRFSTALLIVACLAVASTGSAATITLTTDDAAGTTSFNTAGHWSDGNAPSAANDYSNNGHLLRTPAVSGNQTFAGNSLTIAGGAMAYKGTNAASSDTITVNNLILSSGGVISNYSGNTSAGVLTPFILAGHVTIGSGGGQFNLNLGVAGSTSAGDPIIVTASVAGTGLLTITAAAGVSTQSTYAITLQSAGNTYSGGTTLNANTYLDAQADGALGTGNVRLLGGQLKLELGTTNNYIADTANLILPSTLAAGAVNLAYNGTDVVAGISVTGGTSFLAPGLYGASANNPGGFFSGTGLIQVVPEPATWTMPLLVAICAVLVVATRRRQKN